MRLYVSLFEAKAYYQLSLSNKKHWSWRLALTRESSKQIKDAALQTTPHFVGRIARKRLALLDNELFPWPLVHHFPQIIFYSKPFHFVANNELIVSNCPLMRMGQDLLTWVLTLIDDFINFCAEYVSSMQLAAIYYRSYTCTCKMVVKLLHKPFMSIMLDGGGVSFLFIIIIMGNANECL